MRVLVTGGNTMVPIDAVRAISNGFRGRTAVNVALEACRRGHHVHLLASDPDVFRPSAEEPPPPERWTLERYQTFDDLHSAMRRAIERDRVDAVIHSAAVSDYRVEGAFTPAADTGALTRIAAGGAGKLKSTEPELWLRLVPTPKLIDLVRTQWHFSGVLVKFKLEVGVDAHELREIADRSRAHSGADLVVANTLQRLTLIGPIDGRYTQLNSRRELAARLLDAVEALARDRGAADPTS